MAWEPRTGNHQELRATVYPKRAWHELLHSLEALHAAPGIRLITTVASLNAGAKSADEPAIQSFLKALLAR